MSGRTVIATILVIVALLAIAVGVVYMTVPIHSLPSFLPGHGKGAGHYFDTKHSKRGLAVAAGGVVILIVAIALAATGRRERASYRY